MQPDTIINFLFLPDINLNRHPCKIEIIANLIFKIPAIWLFDVLRQVGKKRETRRLAWQLNYIFYLHKFTFDHFNSRFERFQDTLFGKRRNKKDWHINKRCDPFFNLLGKLVGARVVFFNQIPLVNQRRDIGWVKWRKG